MLCCPRLHHNTVLVPFFSVFVKLSCLGWTLWSRMTYCVEHPSGKSLLMPVEMAEPNPRCYVCSEVELQHFKRLMLLKACERVCWYCAFVRWNRRHWCWNWTLPQPQWGMCLRRWWSASWVYQILSSCRDQTSFMSLVKTSRRIWWHITLAFLTRSRIIVLSAYILWVD